MRIGPLASALMFGALLAAPLTAQTSEDNRWQFTLEDGSYIWDIGLIRLDGGKIIYRQADTLARVPLAKVTEIRLIRKTETRIGEGIGGGGTIAALTGADDEIYDLGPLDFTGRLRTVQQILLMHPPGDSAAGRR